VFTTTLKRLPLLKAIQIAFLVFCSVQVLDTHWYFCHDGTE